MSVQKPGHEGYLPRHLLLSLINTRVALEVSAGAKKEDMTRLKARIGSMAATMEAMMALLRTLTQRLPRPN
jgi:hypothetical protein